jgi:DNA-directed RNA polymerase alpha subunit
MRLIYDQTVSQATGDGDLAMREPVPELPDDTPTDTINLPTRIRNVLNAAGLRTVGAIRETSDGTLLSLPDLGKGSVAYLRETLGLPSTDGVRPDAAANSGQAKNLR